MSTKHVLPEWFLDAAAQRSQPPKDLGQVASTFLGTLYTDIDWNVVQRELERLARDNSIEGILERQHEALLGVRNIARWEVPDPADVAALRHARKASEASLAEELQTTETEFHAHVDEITDQLPEAAKAAEGTPEDSSLAQAAARISRQLERADLSKLGPYWTLIILYWLIVRLTADQIAALTLLYMVASDAFKKKD
jgi:hypothetical protein